MPAALYPRLLGESWPEVDASVQENHCCGGPLRTVGVFQISRGTGIGAKFLLMLLRLPAAADAAQVSLTVTPDEHGETGSRTIGGRPIVTVQRELAGGLLGERFGAFEIRFRLEVVEHAICYRQMGVTLLPFGISLPAWASPCVSAREAVDGVSVELLAPCIGLLLRYEGKLTRTEARP